MNSENPAYRRVQDSAVLAGRFLAAALLTLFCPGTAVAQLVPAGSIEFSGDLVEVLDISAVQRVGNHLLIASDEGSAVQVLRKIDDAHYAVILSLQLGPKDGNEIDIEAVAGNGQTLYALGSHSRIRPTLSYQHSQADNRQRLAAVKVETTRDKLLRFSIDPDSGRPTTAVEVASLRDLYAAHPLLKIFADIPGKENGIDLEGLAAVGDRLYIGHRGPVLRDNYVPVLSLEFDDVKDCSSRFSAHPDRCRLLFVNLGGRGVRSLHRVQDGFLVLAGPLGDGDLSSLIYFWDGLDCLPGRDAPRCTLEVVGEVPAPSGGAPEGLAVLAEGPSTWQLMIVYDGTVGGAPLLFHVPRP